MSESRCHIVRESMMPEQTDDLSRLVAGLRSNDSSAIREFHDRYGRILHAVAEQQIASRYIRRFDADDVVQSAFRTFFRRAKGGEFQFEDCEHLWSLLCAITLNKVREKVRYYGRRKRSLQRDVSVDSEASPDGEAFDIAGRDLTPAEAAEFADEFEQLMATLDGEEQMLVDLKLQDCTNEEAAVRMAVSERTVRRILGRVKLRLTARFEIVE